MKASTFRSPAGPAAAAGAYATSYGYDPNGNLLTLTRNDRQGRAIDNLTYRYNRDAAGQLTGNRLRGVADGSGQASGVADQAAATDNYTYDETGNLTADAQDRIQIEWTVYGKVKVVTNTMGLGANAIQNKLGDVKQSADGIEKKNMAELKWLFQPKNLEK